MDKKIIYSVVGLAVGLIFGYGAKVESRTKVVIQEVQPKCEHVFRSLSCVVTGETSSKTANVIQECEKCGNVRRERIYL